jgi:large subunit ribosomal protein L35
VAVLTFNLLAKACFEQATAPKYHLHTPYSVPILRALFQRKLTFMRRPKGIKTRKAVAKRFKITGTGKVLRSRAGKRHLLQTKSAKRRRGLGGTVVTDKTDEYRIKQNLPFTR